MSDQHSSQSQKTSQESSMKVKPPREMLPPLRRHVAPMPDGFRLGQFNEKQVNGDVHDLRAAVSELQKTVQILINERNG